MVLGSCGGGVCVIIDSQKFSCGCRVALKLADGVFVGLWSQLLATKLDTVQLYYDRQRGEQLAYISRDGVGCPGYNDATTVP